ncbi:hypothetical protein VKS41_004665 [Umbelopsis sp. WA50703]
MTTYIRAFIYIVTYILIAAHVIFAVPLGPLRNGVIPFAQTDASSNSLLQQPDSLSKREDLTGSPEPNAAYPHGNRIVDDLLRETEFDKAIDYTDGNRTPSA